VDGWLFKLGVLDFAGGLTIHTPSGVGALVIASYLEKRNKITYDPHNLIYTFVGCFLIWVGWFCFNGGSSLGANSQAVEALVNTELAAAWGGLAQMLLGR